MSALRAVRGKDRDPIQGLRPRRALIIEHGRRKGPPRALRPLTRATASPVAWQGDAVAPPAVRPGGAAAARSATRYVMLKGTLYDRPFCLMSIYGPEFFGEPEKTSCCAPIRATLMGLLCCLVTAVTMFVSA
ncbi:hypothetical protein NDU88_002452 [Pleurodeles waltl]|uniref:Uncharacterized protein n=1 Tax=Pleurodeles waltl TaxID=8319 RepID=A0AAV7KUT7_PLEWA|nr:hypothetical protein NDU88_002452 [Pleurodeles waltl]